MLTDLVILAVALAALAVFGWKLYLSREGLVMLVFYALYLAGLTALSVLT